MMMCPFDDAWPAPCFGLGFRAHPRIFDFGFRAPILIIRIINGNVNHAIGFFFFRS